MWWKKATRAPVDVDDRLAKLERQVQDLRLEWELAHDKLVSLVHRFNKRAERIVASERQEESENAIPAGSPTATPRALDPVSARILARRASHFPPRLAGNSTDTEKP